MSTNRQHTCCFTGHREIEPQHREQLPQLLEAVIRLMVRDGYYTFLTGGALGFDTLAADTVLRLKAEYGHMRLIVVSPYGGQSDNWNRAQADHFEWVRQSADNFVCLEAGYSPGCMKRRNYYMVERSAICAYYCLRSRSGAAQTMRYAQQCGLELVDLVSLL